MINSPFIPTWFMAGLLLVVMIWFQFYALPKIRQFERKEEEERRKADPTAAPESHSKSSE